MRRFLILLLCMTSCVSVQAQWHSKFKNILGKPPRLHNFADSPKTLAIQRAINRANTSPKSTPHKFLHQATFSIKLPDSDFSAAIHWEAPAATAFVIEENSQGKKQLWGVTAAHYLFENPKLENPAQKTEESIVFVAQGHPGLNDILLFPIPTDMQEQVTPLPLAQQPARPGEKLYSAGFFDSDFHIEKNRVVTNLTPHMVTTSLKVEDMLPREGACGGPVLNSKGEVVGMHVGSSERRQEGFMVPVKNIYDLLHAYYHQGKSLQPFYFNGRKLGEINVNEYIKLIETWKGSALLDTFLPYHHKREIDYEHLENFVDATEADKIVFVVEKIPFSKLDKDQQNHYYKFEYDLKTFHVAKKKIK